MDRNEIISIMKARLIGEWSTHREDLSYCIKEATDTELEYDSYSIEDAGDNMVLALELDGEDAEIVFEIENVGSTWYISGVR